MFLVHTRCNNFTGQMSVKLVKQDSEIGFFLSSFRMSSVEDIQMSAHDRHAYALLVFDR